MRTVPLIQEARERLKLANDVYSANRAAMREDLKFASGEQWPQAVEQQRRLDARPCPVFNETDAFVRQVVNNMRQQRPRIVVHPVSDGADQQTADVIQGLMRHIEVNSNADYAYDTAADFQVRMGEGYLRITTKYVADNSFDQEIHIEPIKNPFTVYLDPMSVSPDGSDAMWVLITERMRRAEFKKLYPNAKPVNVSQLGPGDDTAQWANKEEVIVAEYIRIEEVPEELLQLNNGQTIFRTDYLRIKDAYDSARIYPAVDDEQKEISRPTMRRTVRWSKITGVEEIDTRELPGKYLPVVPVYGAESMGDLGVINRYGMVRNLKDPQRLYNYFRAQVTELMALAPKAPWIIAEGQTEGWEQEWATAHIKNRATLTYKPVTIPTAQGEALLPPPQRTQNADVPAGSIQAGLMARDDMKAIAGLFQASQGADGGETSGKMVAERQEQGDQSNYHFYDNLTRSIRWLAKILLDWIPVVYDTERVMRIIGVDQKAQSVTINEQSVEGVLKDVRVGRYDVVMETGPGYQTKREQSFVMLMELARAIPEVMQNAADLIVRQSDAPGAEAIADRIEAMTPAAQLKKQIPEDLDPKAKQIITQLMAQSQQLQKQVQQLTMEKQAHVFGVQAKEQASTERAQMQEQAESTRQMHRENAETHRKAMEIAGRLRDTSMRDDTSLHETLIDAHTNLEIAHRQAMSRGQPNANRSAA